MWNLVIDTNLFILYILGLFREKEIVSSKRTSHYTIEDFELLKLYIQKAEKIFITPQILAEVSNLFNEKTNQDYAFSKLFVDIFKDKFEKYVSKEEIFSFNYFRFLGVTDSSLFFVAKKTGSHILTDDESCANYIHSLYPKTHYFSDLKKEYLADERDFIPKDFIIQKEP